MTLDSLITAALLALALFLTMLGIGLFVAGLFPGLSAPWWKQYGYSAVCLTCAYYLFRMIFGLP